MQTTSGGTRSWTRTMRALGRRMPRVKFVTPTAKETRDAFRAGGERAAFVARFVGGILSGAGDCLTNGGRALEDWLESHEKEGEIPEKEGEIPEKEGEEDKTSKDKTSDDQRRLDEVLDATIVDLLGPTDTVHVGGKP